MRFSKRFALAALLVATSARGGLFAPDEPYQTTQIAAERSLKQGEFDSARAGMLKAVEQAPAGPVRDQLDARFRKLLLDRAWYECKRERLDESFQLAEWARTDAPDRLLKTYADELARIDRSFGEKHRSLAALAEAEPDLEKAVQHWSEVARIPGVEGEKALAQKRRVEKSRLQLVQDLAEAEKEIAEERWEDAQQATAKAAAADRSLRSRTAELDRLRTDSHYKAAIRDASAFLASNQFAAAYAKVGEAAAVSPQSEAHAPLRTRIQGEFAKATASSVAAAVKADDREALGKWSRAYGKFDLNEEAGHWARLVENRNKADALQAAAETQMRGGKTLAAAESLEAAKILWPERGDFAQLAANLRTSLPLGSVESDLVASRHLDDDGAYGFWTERGGRTQPPWGSAEYVWASQRVIAGALAVASNRQAGGAVLVSLLYGIKARAVAAAAALPDARNEADRWLAGVAQAADARPWVVKLAIDVKMKENAADAVNPADLMDAAIRSANPTRYFQVAAGSDAAADYRIEIAIDQLNVKSTVENDFQTVRYVASVEYDPNPLYAQLQAQLSAAEAEVESARAALNSAQSASLQAGINMLGVVAQSGNPFQQLSAAGNSLSSSMSVSSARSRLDAAVNRRNSISAQLNRTAQTVERKVYSDHSYVVQRHARLGAFQATVQIQDRQGRALGRPGVVSDRFSETDSTHEAFAPADLANDPLELTSEADVLRRFARLAMDGIPDKVGEMVDEAWNSRQSEILKEKDPVLRMERLVALALVAPRRAAEIDTALAAEIAHLPRGSVDFVQNLLASASLPAPP